MELDDPLAPEPGGGSAGGPIVVTDDEGTPMEVTQVDVTQEFEQVENIHEMAARLKELEGMRAEDICNGEGDRSGSPTEVMDVDSNSDHEQAKMSPLEALRKLVENMKETKNAETPPAGGPVVCDEYEMGRSEVQKLKFHVPGELKMPWEKGFAGLVLERKSSIMETKFLDEKTRAPHAIQQEGGGGLEDGSEFQARWKSSDAVVQGHGNRKRESDGRVEDRDRRGQEVVQSGRHARSGR